MTALWLLGWMVRSETSLSSIVLFEGSSDWKELFEEVWRDFSESTLAIGKLSIDVKILSSFSYFSILKRLFLVDFALREDLLFNTSYLIMQPKLGKFVGVLLFLR